MMGRSVTTLALLAGCLAAGSGNACAACTISVTGVAFGSYDVFGTTPLDSTGSVVYTCGKQDKSIRITLSTGSSGTYVARTMIRGTERLNYNIFINGLTVVWGNGNGSTGYYSNNNPPNNRPITVVMYGRVPPLQDVSAGPYADTIQAQIDF